jgi:signal transduction histidine kinase
VFGVSLFHFDLLDRTPIAREAALDAVGDGMVVLDAEGVVVKVDDRAQRVLSPTPEPGDHIATTFPDTELSTLSGTTVEWQSAGSRRTHEVQLSELRDDEHRLIGFVLVLRDVSERRAYEQRLEVANRVLRHNLRNELNVAHGFADQIETGDADDPAAAASRIRETIEGIVETSEKVRDMTRFDPPSEHAPAPVDLAAVGAAVLAEFDPGESVTVERDLSPSVADITDESALQAALQNVLDNAVEHNDRPGPWVELSAGRDDGRVYLEVSDNGPGIPDNEREVLERETETPLKHSQGLGLWLASWNARSAGGELSIESTGADGSTVRLTFPAAEAA